MDLKDSRVREYLESINRFKLKDNEYTEFTEQQTREQFQSQDTSKLLKGRGNDKSSKRARPVKTIYDWLLEEYKISVVNDEFLDRYSCIIPLYECQEKENINISDLTLYYNSEEIFNLVYYCHQVEEICEDSELQSDYYLDKITFLGIFTCYLNRVPILRDCLRKLSLSQDKEKDFIQMLVAILRLNLLKREIVYSLFDYTYIRETDDEELLNEISSLISSETKERIINELQIMRIHEEEVNSKYMKYLKKLIQRNHKLLRLKYNLFKKSI